MPIVDRDPLVNLPPVCPEGNGAYTGWAYYVPRTATTVSGVEIPLFDNRFGWNIVDALDTANDKVNTDGEAANRVGALVVARHCESHNTTKRLEIDRAIIVADGIDQRPLGPVRVSYDYQLATSFEPGAEPENARPLFLPFREGSTFPSTVVPVSYGERRFLVAVPSDAALVRKGFLDRN